MDVLQTLNDKEYLNWIAVGHGLSFMCKGVRPYLQAQMLAFHQHLEGIVGAVTRCVCPGLPRHDMARCAWAQAIANDHFGNPRKIPWKQSDSRQWHDPELGPWQIAKLFMSDLGRHSNAVVDADTTDPTGLLNLMYWCRFLNVDRTKVDALRQARNEMWAHAARQRLTNDEKRDAFLSIRDLLQDATLIHDPDAASTLEEVNRVEGMDLISLQRIQLDVMASFKDLVEIERNQTSGSLDIMNDTLEDIAHQLHLLQHQHQEHPNYHQQFQQHQHICMDALSGLYAETFRVIEYFILPASKKLIKAPWKVPLFLLCFFTLCLVLQDGYLNDACFPMLEEHGLDPELREFNFTAHLRLVTEYFTGRQWLFRDMEEILENNSDSSVLLVHGPPGSGKSSLAAKLICSNTSSILIHGAIMGYHICRYDDKKTHDAARFVRNLARMIAFSVPGYRKKVIPSSNLSDALSDMCPVDIDRCFQKVIIKPLWSLFGDGSHKQVRFIVIDALDECREGSSVMDIVKLIRRNIDRFPSNIKFIMTSRSLPTILKLFSPADMLEIYPKDPRILEDIELYLDHALYQFHTRSFSLRVRTMLGYEGKTDFLTSVERLKNRSQGNFLFVKESFNYILENSKMSNWFQRFPHSLTDTYQKHFERAFPTSSSFEFVRDILEVLAASLFPLHKTKLFEILRMQKFNIDYEYDFIPMLEKLSHVICQREVVTIYHQAVVEWLTKRDGNEGYFVSRLRGCRVLADYYLYILENGKINGNNISTYETFIHTGKYISCADMNKTQEMKFRALPSQLFNDTLPNRRGRTALHEAVLMKDANVVRLIAMHFTNVDQEDEQGLTPAFLSVIAGDEMSLEVLSNLGANLRHGVKDCFCNWEIFQRMFPVIKNVIQRESKEDKLKESDVFLQPSDQYGCRGEIMNFIRNLGKNKQCKTTMLVYAATLGHEKVIKYLLYKVKESYGETNILINMKDTFQIAVLIADANVVRHLFNAGIKPDHSHLYYAVSTNNSELVHYFLSKGVRNMCERCDKVVNLYGNHFIFRDTAIHIAASKGYTNIVELLVGSDASAINCLDIGGMLPVHRAVLKGHRNVLKVFLRVTKGAIAIAPCLPTLSLHSHPDMAILKELTSCETHVYHSLRCLCKITPLHLAAKLGLLDITNDLAAAVKKGDLNPRDCTGATPLHFAACHNRKKVFSLLSEKGANVNSRAGNGSTPFHSAAVCGATEMFDKMAKLKADPLIMDVNGMSVLHYTIKDVVSEDTCESFNGSSFKPFAELYVGEQYNVRNSLNLTWLDSLGTLVVMFETSEAYLARDSYGQTVLHIAIRNGLRDAVWVLMYLLHSQSKKVEFIYIQDNSGLTAFDVALDAFEKELCFSKLPPGDVITGNYDDIIYLLMKYDMTKKSDYYLDEVIWNHLIRSTNLLLERGVDINYNRNGKGSPLMKYLRIDPINKMGLHLQSHTYIIKVTCGLPFLNSPLHMLAYRMSDFVSFYYAPSHFRWSLKQSDLGKYLKIIFANAFMWHPLFLELNTEIYSEKGPLARGLDAAVYHYDKYVPIPFLLDICKDEEGYSVLHRASQGANIAAVDEFLAMGANPNYLTPEGYNSLQLAILFSSKKYRYVVQNIDTGDRMVFLRICDVELASKVAVRLLHELMKRNPSYLKGSITCGNELNLFHIASARGLSSFINVTLLQELGANKEFVRQSLNCKDKNNVTPLYLANLYNNLPRTATYEQTVLWPWVTTKRVIASLGGGEVIYPYRDAELFLIYNCLSFGREPFHLDLSSSVLTSLKENLEMEECKSLVTPTLLPRAKLVYLESIIKVNNIVLRHLLFSKNKRYFCQQLFDDVMSLQEDLDKRFDLTYKRIAKRFDSLEKLRLRIMYLDKVSAELIYLRFLQRIRNILYKYIYVFAMENEIEVVMNIILDVTKLIRCRPTVAYASYIKETFTAYVSKELQLKHEHLHGSFDLHCSTDFMAERMGWRKLVSIFGLNYDDITQGWPLEFIIRISRHDTADLEYLRILNVGLIPPL